MDLLIMLYQIVSYDNIFKLILIEAEIMVQLKLR